MGIGAIFQIGMVVAVVAMLSGGVAWLEHLVSDRAKTQFAVESCVADKSALGAVIDDQGKSIKALQVAGDERAKKAAAALAAAVQESRGHAALADHLLAQRAEGDVCIAAQKLMSEYATGRQVKKP